MKQLILLLTLCIPGLLSAQEDAKYLAGAVPEKDGLLALGHVLLF